MLDNISLGYSTLGQTIYLYRHGKDKGLALEKKPFEAEVMLVLAQHMMDGTPKGSIKTFTLGDKKFELTLKPIDNEVK